MAVKSQIVLHGARNNKNKKRETPQGEELDDAARSTGVTGFYHQ